ncbi:hypothetical protein PSTG_03017 [Puccinia striiformis f. sp. tritici PST-78]|uniref:Uncharacterized protein n=1 Tax=Puccinia striiformis f. sp. tritici PST-78 TaxID=1165861 RepID=A0A0L0VY31_9BASI|nr:hypothetical protein PSTG_03017 [Puccinia striiformis f. sp. tritici PST-78]
MIEEIQKFKWPHFKGKAHWIRCFAHILNLIAQVILRPFGSHKKNQTNSSSNIEADPDQQIESFHQESGDSDYKGEEEMLAKDLINSDEVELETKDVNELSDEEESDQYTTDSCKQALAKLNKSPNSKALFKDYCKEHECSRARCEDLVELHVRAIEKYHAMLGGHKDKRHGTAHKYHIHKHNLDLAGDLANILQPFYKITLQVLTWGAAQISHVVLQLPPENGPTPQWTGQRVSGSLRNHYTNPLNVWLTGWLHLDNQGLPVNALKWWIQQRRKVNTHGGLLQMALDVLSCPVSKLICFFHSNNCGCQARIRFWTGLCDLLKAPSQLGNGKIKRGVSRKWKQQQNDELEKKNKEKAQMKRIEID